jgi:trimethylamine--corrinoid protein Co-methyltransferase
MVLEEEEKQAIHEASLRILAGTGLRVNSARARKLLKDFGAEVHDSTVRLPQAVVEQALSMATREFSLGARREGWNLPLNAGNCVLCMDGQGVSTLDRESGQVRPSTYQDLLEATILGNALDEVGVYWTITTANDVEESPQSFISYLRKLLKTFTKHIQEPVSTPEESQILREVLQIVFGSSETIRKSHPWSFLLCPQSPLTIEESYTDAYLELAGLDIPVGAMPMPLMGATAPASLSATAVVGNSEVLGMLCIVQAAQPGTPFIYAPALSLMDPRTGGYLSGAIENGILGAVETEMARYYKLPVMASGGSTSHFMPSLQSAVERGMNGLLTALSWPDIMVGPGLLGGSMILSLEQFYLDVEMFRMSRRAAQGLQATRETLLEELIARAGPGGHFLEEDSTVAAIRSGEWYLSEIFTFGSYEQWVSGGKPSVLDRVRERVDQILASHEDLPLSAEVEKELHDLQARCG